jgi:very-short-patch-repair endonuclease
MSQIHPLPPLHEPADPAHDSERIRLVDAAREEWIAKLIDLSRRNNLLYFRSLKVGTMEFTDADPDELGALLRGEAVPVMDLVSDEDQERREEERSELAEGDEPIAEVLRRKDLEQRVAVRLREIRRKALENLEEKGLDTLHLAIGMATWPTDDGGRPPEAPVILVPVTIQTRGTQERAHTLKRTGDVKINPVLLHAIENAFGILLDADDILAQLPGAEEEMEDFDPEPITSFLQRKLSNVEGFAIEPRVVLGNFAFAKMAMVRDLRENAEVLYDHDLIGAVAGHDGAREAIRPEGPDPDPREFDQHPPEAEHLILDADSSQQTVIAQVLAGRNGVVQGPPGTGKSQTIANLIAALAARRKKVLFVAEKRAALEVVMRRLDEVGLGHLVFDLHSAGVSRKDVLARVKVALDQVQSALPVDGDDCHRDFSRQRDRLNSHVDRLHTPREPSGLSAYELKGEILGTPEEARLDVRWRGSALAKLTKEVASRAEVIFEELAGLEHLFLRDDPSPWTGAELTDGDAVRAALDEAASLSAQLWPDFQEELDRVLEATGLREPTTLAETRWIARLVQDVARTVKRYGPEIYREDLGDLTAALAPATRGRMPALWAFISDSRYRAARKALRERRKDGAANAPVLVEEAAAALKERERWSALSTGTEPRAISNPEQLGRTLQAATDSLIRIAGFLQGEDLQDVPLPELSELIAALGSDGVTPHRIPRLLELERELQTLGIGNLVRAFRDHRVPADLWRDALRFTWYSSCLDKAWGEDPSLAAFSGRAQDRYVNTFRTRDQERLHVAAARVRREHAERVTAVMNEFPAQQALIRSEANKKSRHLPLRKLLEQAPDVLTALFPCWMASPLSVSQLLGGDRRYFDFALFDEASQVPPEDALPAIMRADRLVVAGDRHQLPPTAFFADGGPAVDEDGNDTGGVTAGFESLLDAMDALIPSWMLEWHYRSRDEALIAFSNRHIYSDRLVTFPGPGRTPAVSHEFVDHNPGQDGQEDSASLEVKRVVDLVLAHAEQRPKETLGVIALGIKHARRIQMELDSILPLRPDLEDFFDQSRDERFFVKNLERVQGDERDAIILSVGYGKDRGGNLPYRFGPILESGGERRLNVAVTRARVRMTVVSSFTHHDMDPNRSNSKGVEFLRLYLQYAASGGQKLGDEGTAPIPLNSFEADIKDALEAKGIPLIPQYGSSRYRIDLVAQHPERPGRFVMAIECDGATYHSSPTARDRDRLRQQMLEGLGWRFHRIWSTDWFTRRGEEIERAVAAYQRAVAYAEELDEEGAGALVVEAAPVAPAPTYGGNGGPSERGPAPIRLNRPSITDYSRRDLVKLIHWLKSDGRLRTHDQLIEEAVQALGFRRRGARIVDALRGAINAAS